MPLSTLLSLRKVVAITTSGLLFASGSSAYSQITGSATITSDYVWRGSSQTREEPAVQAAFKYTHDSGIYSSVWGSNVSFVPDAGARSEFDIAIGWSGDVSSDWAMDVYWLRYQYPEADINLNWNEINAVATWRDNYWFSAGYSTNTMASDSTGTYLLAGAKYPLNDEWRVEGSVARYILEDVYADGYTTGSVGIVWTFDAPFEARLTLHDTTSSAEKLFPGMAESRVEFAIQTSF